ncbi:MAG: MFS transporter [Ignavibacteriales bacterium]|nr:MFS transporter [Ignavibacteriales bacterium]
MLKSNRRMRDVIIVDALALMSMTAGAFYAVYAIEKFQLPASYAGTFTVLVMASMVAGNVVFGFLADHFGHRVNWLLLSVCSAAASIMAIVAANILVYGLVFFFMACSTSLQGISRLSLIAELCTEAERPVYIALVNTITAPAVFVGIFCGALARWYGYPVVFGIATVLACAACLWTYFFVEEPRSIGGKAV